MAMPVGTLCIEWDIMNSFHTFYIRSIFYQTSKVAKYKSSEVGEITNWAPHYSTIVFFYHIFAFCIIRTEWLSCSKVYEFRRAVVISTAQAVL